jgi:hypothetical protein
MVGFAGSIDNPGRRTARTKSADFPEVHACGIDQRRRRDPGGEACCEGGVMSKRFDAIVIGAGQARPSLATRLAGAGLSAALIERKLFGGTCVNTGCMPTKTLVTSVYAVHLARRAADYGVVLDAPPRIDMARVKARADRNFRASASRRRELVASHQGVHGDHRSRLFSRARHARCRRGEGERAVHLHQCRRPPSTPPRARISESLESSISWSRSLKPAPPNAARRYRPPIPADDRNGLRDISVCHGFPPLCWS